MHRLLLVLGLLAPLLLGACATYRSSFGYAATDLSWLERGMSREKVEDRLGESYQFYTLEQGSLAVYEYNQGYIPPMEKNPEARVVGMPIIFFAELFTLGGLSYVTVSTADCHIAELRILYGTSENVLAATECPGHPKTTSCEDPQSSRRPSTLSVSFKDKASLQHDCEYPRVITNVPDSNNVMARDDGTSLQYHSLNKEIDMYCPNAELGQADAQKHIADIFFYGRYSVNRDVTRAYVWYRLSAMNGNSIAEAKVQKLETEMSNDQLIEASRRYQQWQPGSCRQDILKAASRIPE